MRTITASYEPAACITIFGQKIAIACDDGTVAIYESATGVLELSLNPTGPVSAMKGSQDGSLLFCAHQRPSVTLWDIQTGGLIHTFALEQNARDIAVSSKDLYLACAFPDSTVKIWEVPTKVECAPIGDGLEVTHICWLDPKEQLAVTIRGSVQIWDVASARVLHRFTMLDPTIRGIAYSQELGELVILTTSRTGSAVNIIDPHQGSPSVPHGIRRSIYCFALSLTTNQLVCGTEIPGLEVFNISTQHWWHFKYPGRITFVSFLPNGTVVAEVAGSGIQVLNLDEGRIASQQPTIPALAVHTFDKKNEIIAVTPTTRDRIVLLELATMSRLLTIPVQESHHINPDPVNILCASLEDNVAVCWRGSWFRGLMQLWGFHDEHPKWSVEVLSRPSICGTSPSGRLVVAYVARLQGGSVSVRDGLNGALIAWQEVDDVLPLDITFESQTRFCFHHGTYRKTYRVSCILAPEIRPLGRLPLGKESQKEYHVDETLGWVIDSGSRRICWIPPGYIGSVKTSYCWAGSSLVMAGQDGMLRKLTFYKTI